ncbi:MAG: bifunctional diguanylate cyclase/phosphodiesterase [Acidimicrobiales bacterium]
MGNDSGILKTTFAVALALVVLLAVGTAGAAWTHASEQRHIATAASDLQVAAMTLAAADSLLLDGEQPGGLQLGHAVLALSTNREMALRPLSPGDANRANELLDEIAANSLTLLDHGARGHEIHGHGELHDLLAHAADEAESGAIAAEQRALGAVVLASLAVMVGFWLVLKSRFRSEHDRERAELQAREGRRLEALLDDSPDSAFVIDLGGRIVYRSESGNRLLGLEFGAREDLVALASPAKRDALRDHLRRADASGDSAVFSLRDQSGVWGWYQIRVSDLSDNRTVDGHVVTARNITNEVLLRDELQRQADTDHLTGLPNRRVLQRALVTASNRLTECGGLTAVMTLDIDGFKSINDTLGHAAGDELLIRVAERLNGAKAEDHVLLRLGGDEFALIAPSVASVADAETQARALLAAFDDPFRLGSRVERVRTSVGVATTAEPSRVDGLLREADVAMYESKRRGGSSVVMHDPLVADSSARTDRIAAALRTADHDAEFHVMYQPIVEIHSGTVTGLEALLRWTSPELGPVSPDEFVPVAETTGDICEIGKWVIDSVFCQFAAWIEAGIDPSITVSFNVSPRQLADERFVPCVLETAAAWGVPPSRLVVEVTESTALDHAGVAIARLEQLRAAGIRISIDDFGSGYSNLGQLLTVPFDVIKIDRSLLLTLTAMRQQAGGDATDACAIMSAIVSIASVLQAPVVCEGVETDAQRTSLAASGITHVQGYLTGRPASGATITSDLCPATRPATLG